MIKIFSEIARGLKKTDLMGLIQNSKKYLEMAEKEEAFWFLSLTSYFDSELYIKHFI